MNIQEIMHSLVNSEDVTVSEDLRSFGLYNLACNNAGQLLALREFNRYISNSNFGTVNVYGKISGHLDIEVAPLEHLKLEPLDVVVDKKVTDNWAYFFSVSGFLKALQEDKQFVSNARAIWIAEDFAPFSSFLTLYSPWDGPRDNNRAISHKLEDPRRLVRDLTQSRTPAEIAPWLLAEPPNTDSTVYSAWRKVCTEKLVFSLPAEIAIEEGNEFVRLRSSRSLKLLVDMGALTDSPKMFDLITEAATWVYALRRESESKLLFLNEHLSGAWNNEESWPLGLVSTLSNGLANARTSFAFHLQEESKDALKAMAELRKSLQDEVLKAQQTTRDVLTTVWRDFAIAATVLAIRYLPNPASNARPESHWLAVGVAAFLVVSLAVTVASHARFNYLAAQSRHLWRTRIYAFVSQQEWDILVTDLLAKVTRVFRSVLAVAAAIYVGLIIWLLWPYIAQFCTWVVRFTFLTH